jgi:hypothetical protein
MERNVTSTNASRLPETPSRSADLKHSKRGCALYATGKGIRKLPLGLEQLLT